MNAGVTTELMGSEPLPSEDFSEGAANWTEKLSRNRAACADNDGNEEFTTSLGKLSAAVSAHKPSAAVPRAESTARSSSRISEQLGRNSKSVAGFETNRRVIAITTCERSSVADVVAEVLAHLSTEAIDLDFARLRGWDSPSLSALLSTVQRNAAQAAYVINWQHLFIGLERHLAGDHEFWYTSDVSWVPRMASLRDQFERLTRNNPCGVRRKCVALCGRALRRLGYSKYRESRGSQTALQRVEAKLQGKGVNT
jgi:hypothetical protein